MPEATRVQCSYMKEVSIHNGSDKLHVRALAQEDLISIQNPNASTNNSTNRDTHPNI